MPPINILLKPASGLCNLRCGYCFYHDEMQNRTHENYGIMSEEVLEAVIQKTLAFADEMCGISFQGGEPTLAGLSFFETVAAFQKKHNKKGLNVSNAIQTNGIGLTQDWARFFVRNRFLVGLSLDGIKSSHDDFRKDANGDGTFSRVKDTAFLFDQNRVEYNILTVVNAKTAINIERIYRFYQRSDFRFLQFIACLDPIGETPGQREYSLTPEIYGKFLCDLFDLWYEDLMQGKQPYIRSFENYIGILCGWTAESCDMRGVCGMQYVVEADGSVYPCDFYMLDEFRLGNLLTDDFPELDRRRQEIGFIQKSEERSSNCMSCRWFTLCRGGCMRHRFIQGTELQNYFCQSYQRFFDYAAERMIKIAEALQQRQS